MTSPTGLRRPYRERVSIALLLACLPFLRASGAESVEDLFEREVRPVLVETCLRCHGEKRAKAGVRLDGRAFLLRPVDGEPVVVAGKPEESRLVRAIRHEGGFAMPPKEKLPDATIEAFETWIRAGAPWPGDDSAERTEDESADHWAFRPVTEPQPPVATGAESAVDRFVVARLRAAGLELSPAAERRRLIRRVTLDLTGLLPAVEDVAAFAEDAEPEAWEKVVDRLLASPRHGERWGRHWLDVARYADTRGYVFNQERRYPYSYTYRDYVIASLNEDLPYDRFIVEQLAADRLDLESDPKPLAALGFLTLGRRFLNNPHDIIDDRIDVVSRGLLGLTVGCARCHDHKYDPIPTADYYSLYGVFASSVEPDDLPRIGPALDRSKEAAYREELGKREAAVESYQIEKHSELLGRLRSQAGRALEALVAPEAESAPGTGVSVGENDVHPRVVERWKAWLDSSRERSEPVFAAWHALSALPENELAARAPEVLEKAAASWNPVVVATLRERPPATRRELATRYGELLARAEELWTDALSLVEGAGAAPAALDDASWEALRLVLHGPDSPIAISLEEAGRFFDRATRDHLRGLQRRVDELEVSHEGAPARAMVLTDAPSPRDVPILKRGKPGNHGPVVPRRFLAVLAGEDRAPFQDGSGRLELAHAIASADNPLTARVLVNRVWAHHFGKPIVSTPSDFGTRSDPPTHPLVLDWLASRLAEEGWSLKRLHRQLLLTAAYRQSSSPREEGLTTDPENRLLWRQNARRLEFEALRDTLVQASGDLDGSFGGRSIDLFARPFPTRRAVYGFIDRQNLPGVLRSFDFASPDSSSPGRHETTVPQQGLWLMNNDFVEERAARLVARPDFVAADAEGRVDWLFRTLLARPPADAERDLARSWLDSAASQGLDEGLAWRLYTQALFLTNEFLFVD